MKWSKFTIIIKVYDECYCKKDDCIDSYGMSFWVLKTINGCCYNLPKSKTPNNFKHSVNDLNTFRVCNRHFGYAVAV